jgi:hypothetical protein
MQGTPSRQIHLDFHTGPAIPGVGADFDPEVFAKTLKAACVDSVTLFAKCHHGLLYYDTTRAERHPGLMPGLDLLGAQIKACRSVGIRTPIYLSVQCDEYAANLHPEWVCLDPEGVRVGRKPLGSEWGSWQILDMSSPYADFLAEQIEEVVARYAPVDGVFLDMCWDQISLSKWAKAGMKAASLDPTSDVDRKKYANAVTHRYMERYNKLIGKANGGALPGVFYNSRSLAKLNEETKYLKHIEIEALPTGGWGYTYFPLNVRWARNFGLPYIGMTARFHKSWSDFGGYKPNAALKYEVAQMAAHGAGCSIGDQLHPRGVLDPEAYHRISEAYKHIESISQWCVDAVPLTDVAVLRDPTTSDQVLPGTTFEGVIRLLQQLAVQFDLVHHRSDFSKYKLVIVPNLVSGADSVGDRLIEFMNAGGKVILAGMHAITSAPQSLRLAAGIEQVTETSPGMKVVYFRYDRTTLLTAERSDVVCYDGTASLLPARGAIMPAFIVESYFERSWDRFSGHGQTPPAKLLKGGPVTVTTQAAAFGFDVFKAFAEHGQEHLKRLFAFVIRTLLPDPIIRCEMPSHAELSVTQQHGRSIVHILSYAPQRRTPLLEIVEEATPLVNRKISLKLSSPPKSVTRQPSGEPMNFEYAGGYASVLLTSDAGHDLLVFEQ